MNEKRNADPLPDEFASFEEAAEFWDSHDTTDYPEAFAQEPTPIEARFTKRHFEIEIDEDLFTDLRQRALASDVSVKRLANELLRRQLAAQT
jgi:hypothetical protein